MDRTESFREAVLALTQVDPHYDKAASNKLKASLLMPRNPKRSEFLTQASRIRADVHALEALWSEHQRDYMDSKRCTEKDRDNIDDKVIGLVNAMKKSIDDLKNSIQAGKKPVNADTNAHLHGIVLILSEQLQVITASYDAVRTLRCRQALQKKTARRRPIRRAATAQLEADLSNPASLVGSSRFQLQETVAVNDETRLLQQELTELLDSVEAAERKTLEVSALNHIFMTHVLQQTQQIELLYEEAVRATRNVTAGNKEISKAISRSSSSRTFLLMFLIILPLSLLYLDWYSS